MKRSLVEQSLFFVSACGLHSHGVMMRNPIFRIGFSPTLLLAVASVVKCILVLTRA